MEWKNVWKNCDGAKSARIDAFAKEYMDFLSECKTERECVSAIVAEAEKRGFSPLSDCASIKPGDRVYVNHMGKSLLLFVIGSEPLERGMNILGAHIDSPRVDVKPNPLYEDGGLGYLDTHYYGGIKKYQWVTLPLALHGVIVKKSGEAVTLSIGESADEPVFCITDLLPHLAQDQMKLDAAKIINGEDMDLLIAGRPLAGEEKDAVRAGVLRLLRENYGVEEEDFLSAELEIVPAGRARDLGLDRSMILAYGHDDRVCAYPSARAVMDFEGVPERTLCCILTDKEEIGSVGATGMDSMFFENAAVEALALAGEGGGIALRRALANSCMLSSDVAPGFDPLYASVYEKKNTAYLGSGLCFMKYTGSGGKGYGSDANPEFIAKIRSVLDEAGVCFQFTEIGKVDQGGGGTIAELSARYCMNVIDAGIAVLSMHSPYEVVSKADVYETYLGYSAFLRDIK